MQCCLNSFQDFRARLAQNFGHWVKNSAPCKNSIFGSILPKYDKIFETIPVPKSVKIPGFLCFTVWVRLREYVCFFRGYITLTVFFTSRWHYFWGAYALEGTVPNLAFLSAVDFSRWIWWRRATTFSSSGWPEWWCLALLSQVPTYQGETENYSFLLFYKTNASNIYDDSFINFLRRKCENFTNENARRKREKLSDQMKYKNNPRWFLRKGSDVCRLSWAGNRNRKCTVLPGLVFESVNLCTVCTVPVPYVFYCGVSKTLNSSL